MENTQVMTQDLMKAAIEAMKAVVQTMTDQKKQWSNWGNQHECQNEWTILEQSTFDWKAQDQNNY